jgi:hypothetical protein
MSNTTWSQAQRRRKKSRAASSLVTPLAICPMGAGSVDGVQNGVYRQ